MSWRVFLATAAVGAAVAAVGGSPALAATTWTVDPAGNDATCPATHVCQHIGVAVALASPGDTINVHKGLYNENVVINKRLTLIGATRPTLVSNCNATTAASPALDTIVDAGGSTFGFDIEADRVSVRGFVFHNANFGVLVDVTLAGAFSGWTIRQNLFEQNFIGLGESSNGALPSLVQQNCFRSNTGDGVLGQGGGPSTNKNVRIVGNKSRSNALYAYRLGAFPADTLDVSGNISTNDGVFLTMGHAKNFTVSGNIVNNPTTGALFENAAMYFGNVSNGTISGNILSRGTGRGIVFDNVFYGPPANTNLTISGNVVTSFPGNGIEATAGALKNSTLNGNITQVNGVNGLLLAGGNTGNSFAGNIFQGKTWGCHALGSSAALNNWNGNSNIGQPMNTPGTCFP
jgi:parallel beta helix pectate lyase-like protein